MRNIIGSLFAIGVAGVAAVAATSVWLDAPAQIAHVASVAPAANSGAAPQSPAPAASKPATPDSGKPEASKPANGAGAAGASDTKDKDDEGDKDPYEGIAPEELPPDLQYSADSSVSFPTNI